MSYTWIESGQPWAKLGKAAGVKAWMDGVPFDGPTIEQLKRTARLPFIYKHVAAMPDAHWGLGSTVGSVIPTERAIVPASVGVDIGCGMIARRTGYMAEQLPDSLASLRADIEKAVPHGRSHHGGEGDRGAWGEVPKRVLKHWTAVTAKRCSLRDELAGILDRNPKIGNRGEILTARAARQLGTLGGGNHFIEVCLDEEGDVWIMLHSGSRGIGNIIGRYFIERAKEEMKRWHVQLPDADLAYIAEGSEHFNAYTAALDWAQRYAWANRMAMLEAVSGVVTSYCDPDGALEARVGETVVHCHHNYVARENHFGKNVWITRKGAVRAREGDMGIIPGSMGARSYIVRGKGCADSFHSCSHGAGRVMSRGAAKRQFSVNDHVQATYGVECRKDSGVIDETPMAYKDIDAVMAAQSDLVDVVHKLKQVVCVKG